MIVGQPGSGKSTLARLIGARTGLPVHHMDHIHWMSGWVQRPDAERLAMATAVETSEAWVFEGGFSRTYAHRLSRADTLIILDPPFLLRVWRVFRRTVAQYGKVRADLPEGCPERFDAEFWSYIWRTRHTGRARILALANQAAATTSVHHLRSPGAVRHFLESVTAPRPETAT